MSYTVSWSGVCQVLVLRLWCLTPLGSWINNYLCNQCLSPPTLWVRIPLRRYVLDTTSREKVCQWLAAGRWRKLVLSLLSRITQFFSSINFIKMSNKYYIMNFCENHCYAVTDAWLVHWLIKYFRLQCPRFSKDQRERRGLWCLTYITWKSMSVTCGRSVVFSGYSSFLHQ
jgi:hypothetical protein